MPCIITDARSLILYAKPSHLSVLKLPAPTLKGGPMIVYMNDGTSQELDITSNKLWLLHSMHKQGQIRCFIRVASEHGEIYRNLSFIDVAKTLHGYMGEDIPPYDPDEPIPFQLAFSEFGD